jgi:hypothetical protein
MRIGLAVEAFRSSLLTFVISDVLAPQAGLG